MKIQAFALALTLAGATAGQASVVNGFNDVTDLGGGIFKFVFDTVPSDIIGTGSGIKFTGGGIDITATSAEGKVIQDHPANGGLGVLSAAGPSDNLELSLGETLMLSFSRSVEIVNFTFNGLLSSDGHTDAADGRFEVTEGSIFLSADAGIFDGVGTDFVPGSSSSVSDFDPTFLDVTSLLFGEDLLSGTSATPFKGYLESVTIKVSPVPVPASFALLALGLGAFGAMGRKKRKAA